MTISNLSARYRLLFPLFCWLWWVVPVRSAAPQQGSSPQSIFEALTQKEAVKMTLETDLTTIIEQKKSSQYFPGTLRTDDGKMYRVELKTRGKFRRKVSIFPPLKLKFKKKDLVAEGLDTLNEIKLVLPCYESELGDELIVREYIAYRMYEHMTGVSLRARLVRLTIRDTHVEKSRRPMYAILLEDEEELVKRLNGSLNENYGVPIDSMNINQTALAVMFEYMIGNTDWEIAMLRNVRLVKTPESGKTLVIPYDFDFSGLVSAPYSSPSSETGLKTVRDRYLMASGLQPEALKKAFKTLLASKSALMAMCDNKYLSQSATNDMVRFLSLFFDKIEGKAEIPQLILMD